jgi:hypothetical protein
MTPHKELLLELLDEVTVALIPSFGRFTVAGYFGVRGLGDESAYS